MEHFRTGFGRQDPEAMECLVNGLERLHGEVKRRINAVGALLRASSSLGRET